MFFQYVFYLGLWCWLLRVKCFRNVLFGCLKKESNAVLSTFSRFIHFIQYEWSESWMMLQHLFQLIVAGRRYLGPFLRNVFHSSSLPTVRLPIIKDIFSHSTSIRRSTKQLYLSEQVGFCFIETRLWKHAFLQKVFQRLTGLSWFIDWLIGV